MKRKLYYGDIISYNGYAYIVVQEADTFVIARADEIAHTNVFSRFGRCMTTRLKEDDASWQATDMPAPVCANDKVMTDSGIEGVVTHVISNKFFVYFEFLGDTYPYTWDYKPARRPRRELGPSIRLVNSTDKKRRKRQHSKRFTKHLERTGVENA